MTIIRRGKAWGVRVQEGRRQRWIGTYPTRTEARRAEDLALAERNRVPRVASPKVIYFVQAGEGGPIKIGITEEDCVDRRLTQLQGANPVQLRLLATQFGGILNEKQLHARFAAHRIHGEWFEPTPELLALIEGIEAAFAVARSPLPSREQEVERS